MVLPTANTQPSHQNTVQPSAAPSTHSAFRPFRETPPLPSPSASVDNRSDPFPENLQPVERIDPNIGWFLNSGTRDRDSCLPMHDPCAVCKRDDIGYRTSIRCPHCPTFYCDCCYQYAGFRQCNSERAMKCANCQKRINFDFKNDLPKYGVAPRNLPAPIACFQCERYFFGMENYENHKCRLIGLFLTKCSYCKQLVREDGKGMKDHHEKCHQFTCGASCNQDHKTNTERVLCKEFQDKLVFDFSRPEALGLYKRILKEQQEPRCVVQFQKTPHSVFVEKYMRQVDKYLDVVARKRKEQPTTREEPPIALHKPKRHRHK